MVRDDMKTGDHDAVYLIVMMMTMERRYGDETDGD